MSTTSPSWFRRTFAALAVPNFRLFYIGQGLSLVGTWMRRTALGWLVYLLTGSMSQSGTVMALTLAPMFVLAPISGSIADKVDKRKMILITQIVACATSVVLALLVATGTVEVWHLKLLALIGGSAFAFEVPARQAFVVELVGRDHLTNAIALNSALVNAARTLGPFLAGILMHRVGIALCFVIDALSYVIVIGTLLALRLPKQTKKVENRSHFERIKEGLQEASRNQPVRLVMLLLIMTGTLGWSFQPLLPAIVKDVLMKGEGTLGLLMGMFGLGAIGGALFSASRAHLDEKRAQLFGGVWLMVFGVLLLSAVRQEVFMSAALLIAGFGAIMFLATGNTLVQMNVTDDIRGRVMGIWALSFGGAIPLGSWLSGTIAEQLRKLDWAKYGLESVYGGASTAFFTIACFGTLLLILSITLFVFMGDKESAKISRLSVARES